MTNANALGDAILVSAAELAALREQLAAAEAERERLAAQLQTCQDDFVKLDRKATAVFELSDRKQKEWEARAERLAAALKAICMHCADGNVPRCRKDKRQ